MEWKNKLQQIKLNFKNMKKDNFIIVLLAGVLLIVIALPPSNTSSNEENESKASASVNKSTSNQNSIQTSYVEEQEKRLETILSRVQGVGDVNVMITLKASKELIVEKDTPATSSTTKEEDAEGGTRNSTDKSTTEATVYQQDSDGGSSPYIVKELEPEIEGIVIIAKGGDDPVVAKNISDAVLALFHVEAHKIKVMKMN